MTIEAWPFLVGRNRKLGYQTIVSPLFLSRMGISSLLAEAAGGDDSGPNEAVYREVLGSPAGDLSLVFRVVKAIAQDYDLGGEEVLRDRSGRPISLIEGFVVQGRHREMRVTRDDLRVAHEQVKKAFCDFWYTDDTFKESLSSPFDLLVRNDLSSPMLLIYDDPLFLNHSSSQIARQAKQRSVFAKQPSTRIESVDAQISRKQNPYSSQISLAKILAILIGSIIVILSCSLANTIYQSHQRDVSATATVTAMINIYTNYVAQHGMMFGFDTQHTRNNPYERILSVDNVSQLQQKWVASVEGGINSSPAVANGLVYVGSSDHKLYAIDAATGQQKWVVSMEGGVNSSPAVANGLVYVGSSDHKLYAIDAVTGQQKWVAFTEDAINSSPAVANGLVYVGSSDHKLYAFDVATGEQKWGTFTGRSINSSPAVANGLVYVGSSDHKLYAFDAATGELNWFVATEDAINSSPAVANGLVYVGSSDHKLYAIDALTGQQKWVASTKDAINSSPALANGLVYVGSSDHKLYAFDAVTGQRRWFVSTKDAINSSPAVANGLVYVGSSDHNLYAFNAVTGQQKWVAATGGPINYSSPIVVNGFVYVGSEDGKLYAFSLP